MARDLTGVHHWTGYFKNCETDFMNQVCNESYILKFTDCFLKLTDEDFDQEKKTICILNRPPISLSTMQHLCFSWKLYNLAAQGFTDLRTQMLYTSVLAWGRCSPL